MLWQGYLYFTLEEMVSHWIFLCREQHNVFILEKKIKTRILFRSLCNRLSEKWGKLGFRHGECNELETLFQKLVENWVRKKLRGIVEKAWTMTPNNFFKYLLIQSFNIIYIMNFFQYNMGLQLGFLSPKNSPIAELENIGSMKR